MRISFQHKLLAAFTAVILLVLSGVSVGISLLIRNYFIANKQHELTNKGYELARVVNEYYDGYISHIQLFNFINSVDSFLDARVWVVDKELNLITVSEERPDGYYGNRQRPEAIIKSPMHQIMQNCNIPGNNDDKTFSPGNHRHGMMGNRMQRQNTNKPDNVQPYTPPGNEQTKIALDMGGDQKPNDTDLTPKVSLAEIKGMNEIIQLVNAANGTTWAKTYYHPYYEENMLIVGVPLSRTDGTLGGTVMINAPLENIDSFLQHIYYYIATAGLVAFLIAVLIANRLAGNIVRPLKSMQQTAAAMARGDYSAQVQVQTQDEVGDLARTLNSLGKDLADFMRQAETMDKMRRDFVANVSHELRTPLTIMRGYNEALLDGTISDPNQAAKYHQVMRDETVRLEKLIAELLDLSALQSSRPVMAMEPVALDEVVDNVCTLLQQRSADKGVKLTADINAGDPLVITGDGDRLTQLVLILVDNALKFTPEGGKVIVGLMAKNESIILTVADTGKGIPQADLPYIWERFYKGDKSRARSEGGTGLGLAIAREIISKHGGSAEVTSDLGQGTTFRIVFPLNQQNHDKE